jgi:hypothetical protein
LDNLGYTSKKEAAAAKAKKEAELRAKIEEEARIKYQGQCSGPDKPNLTSISETLVSKWNDIDSDGTNALNREELGKLVAEVTKGAQDAGRTELVGCYKDKGERVRLILSNAGQSSQYSQKRGPENALENQDHKGKFIETAENAGESWEAEVRFGKVSAVEKLFGS